MFRSFLFDCYSYKETTSYVLAEEASKINKMIGGRSVFITTDGGKNNVAAFREKRSICFCHAINTVISHMMATRSKAETKYGLSQEEANELKYHLTTVHDLCISARGRSYSKFASWVKDWKNVNIDFPDVIPMPETFCNTRWIGIAIHMRWLLNYGLLLYRFARVTGSDQFPDLRNQLDVLKETAWIIFMLEHAMSLLMVSNKPTLHLVIPILEAFRSILNSEPCTSFTSNAAKAMIKLLLYELDQGCLCISSEMHEKYRHCCYIATALYPEADRLVSSEVLEKCMSIAKRYFNEIMYERKLDWNLQCNDFDKVMNSVRSKDEYLFEEGDFIDMLRPSKEKLLFKGIPEILTLYFRQKIQVGKKLVNVNEAKMKLNKRKVPKNSKVANAAKAREARHSISKIEIAVDRLNADLQDMQMKEKRKWHNYTENFDSKEFNCFDLEEIDCEEDLLLSQDKELMSQEDIREVESRIQNPLLVSKLRECIHHMEELAKEYWNEVAIEKRTVKDENLYNFFITYQASGYKSSGGIVPYNKLSGIQLLMEKVLCIPASEAVCERLFRLSSLFAKRQYVTNINNDTVNNVTFCKYYLSQMWGFFIDNKDFYSCLR